MLNRDVSLSVKMHALPDDTARLLATWVIPQLDKHGVFYADPAVVRSLVFPMRLEMTADAVSRILDAMEAVGLIVRFEALGRRWQHWPGFAENQQHLRADRETTTFPPPPSLSPRQATSPPTYDNRTNAGVNPESVRNQSGLIEVEGEVQVEEKGKGAPARARPRREVRGMGEVLTEHSDPRVGAYLELLRPEITPHNADAILSRVPVDALPVWREVLTTWAMSGWRATNFAGMFERCDTVRNSARVRAMQPQGAGAPAGSNPATEARRILSERAAKRGDT